MRTVILVVHMTLDGYMAGPGGALDWMVHDPVMNHEVWLALRDRVDTMLAGRVAHQGFESNFRAHLADPASPPALVEFSTWMVETPTVVFSRTLSAAELSPSARLAGADIPDTVASLKQQPGKDLLLFGGVSTVQAFVRQGLVDEYWIRLHPVAIGAGLPVFADRTDAARLTLLDSKSYDSGIVTLRYRPA